MINSKQVYCPVCKSLKEVNSNEAVVWSSFIKIGEEKYYLVPCKEHTDEELEVAYDYAEIDSRVVAL